MSINRIYSLIFKSRVDFIVMICIILLPFLFFLHNIVPKDKIWKTWLFEFDSGFYYDSKYFFWYMSVKILTLLILSLWFVTCSYNWRFVLIFPIMGEVSKTIFLIKSIDTKLDYDFFYIETFFYSFPVIALLFYLTNELKYYTLVKTFNYQLNNEISKETENLSSFKTFDYNLIRKELKKLKKEKKSINKKEYLIKLIELRDKITV